MPALRFGQPAPFSFDRFLALCEDFIPEQGLKALTKLSLDGEYSDSQIDSAAWEKWKEFDTSLRNELARIRAERKHIDPERYLRQAQTASSVISHLAIGAYRNPSILEAKMALDEQRWRMLDEFSFGHYFDLDLLIVYALKLLLLERWDKINNANKELIIEKILV